MNILVDTMIKELTSNNELECACFNKPRMGKRKKTLTLTTINRSKAQAQCHKSSKNIYFPRINSHSTLLINQFAAQSNR